MRDTLIILSTCLLALVACGTRTDTPNATANSTSVPTASTPDAASNQDKTTNAVRAESTSVRVAPGANAEATVQLTIAAPFHVNANPATQSFLIPTQLTVGKADGIEAGAPVYPKAVTRKFAFDESPLSVYEGTVEIRVPLRVARNAATGERKIPARVRVQPCDDEVCYPPRTIETTIILNVGA